MVPGILFVDDCSLSTLRIDLQNRTARSKNQIQPIAGDAQNLVWLRHSNSFVLISGNRKQIPSYPTTPPFEFIIDTTPNTLVPHAQSCCAFSWETLQQWSLPMGRRFRLWHQTSIRQQCFTRRE